MAHGYRFSTQTSSWLHDQDTLINSTEATEGSCLSRDCQKVSLTRNSRSWRKLQRNLEQEPAQAEGQVTAPHSGGGVIHHTWFWKHISVSKDALAATTFSLGRIQKARICTTGGISTLTDSWNDTVPLMMVLEAQALTL